MTTALIALAMLRLERRHEIGASTRDISEPSFLFNGEVGRAVFA
jgi:hypothetical protein